MQTTVNKKTIPKYLQLSARLKKDIREGIYQRGGQLPTARELTTLLGVSYLTVSNVLQALEKEGYVKRIHGKGTFVTEPAAAKVQDKKKIGYIIDIHAKIFAKLFSSISETLNGQPVYNVPLPVPFGSGTSMVDGELWLEKVMKNRYNSLVVYGDRHFPYQLLSRYFSEIDQLNIIIFDSCAVHFPRVNRILADVEKVGYLAAKRFLKNGWRKMAVLSLQHLDDSYRHRYGIVSDDYSKLVMDGIARAYNEFGEDFFKLVRVVSGPHGGPAGGDKDINFVRDLRQSFKDGCDAYFALGDSRAPAVYKMAEEFNLKVGKDIAVLGFLNDIATCELLKPKLSSISINEAEIGRFTALAIQENWKNRKVMIDPELIIRESDGVRTRKDIEIVNALTSV